MVTSPGPEDASSKVCDVTIGETVELAEEVEEVEEGDILVEEAGEDMVVAGTVLQVFFS